MNLIYSELHITLSVDCQTCKNILLFTEFIVQFSEFTELSAIYLKDTVFRIINTEKIRSICMYIVR